MLRHVLIGLLLAALLTVPSIAAGDDDTIRVRLLDDQTVTRATLQAAQGALHVKTPFHDNTLIELGPDEEVRLGTRSGDVYIRLGDGDGLYAEAIRFVPATEDGTWTLAPDEGTEHTYHGVLALEPDPEAPEQLRFVNRVPLETYVAGVVASEYTLDDTEGAKAMAVVARTYALQGTDRADLDYDHVDHVISQVYRGASSTTDQARNAARATRGEVLTHEGDLIHAVYFSSSGGHTADNEAVWDAQPLPYLRGRDDPYDDASPHQGWRTTVPRDAVIDALSAHFDLDVQGFQVGTRSADGRVETVNVQMRDAPTQTLSSNAFRLALNDRLSNTPLKSTLFEARREGDKYVFEGDGFGHGVGLSQWGAHEMAQRGYSYQEILSFYYTDVSLTTLDRVDAQPVALDDQPADAPAERDTTSEDRRIGW